MHKYNKQLWWDHMDESESVLHICYLIFYLAPKQSHEHMEAKVNVFLVGMDGTPYWLHNFQALQTGKNLKNSQGLHLKGCLPASCWSVHPIGNSNFLQRVLQNYIFLLPKIFYKFLYSFSKYSTNTEYLMSNIFSRKLDTNKPLLNTTICNHIFVEVHPRKGHVPEINSN